MEDKVKTIQSNIKQYTKDMTQYSLFLGGTNVKSKALEQYDPFIGGYGRVFVMKMPVFMDVILPNKTAQFKHLLEYGNTKISGIGNLEMDFEAISGGYTGAQFEIPTVLKNTTTELTITVPEFTGSPVREFVSEWLNGMADQMTGLRTYGGAYDIDPTIEPAQANQTMELVYVLTDTSGRKPEFVSLVTNMVPKNISLDHMNTESGSHPIVMLDLQFTATTYMSSDINALGAALLKKRQIKTNYKELTSGYTLEDVDALPPPNIRDWN